MRIMRTADILLPCVEDPMAWSVIACDQFTSQPDYWAAVERRVGSKPSTLHLMMPEAWMNTPRALGAGKAIERAMESCLARGVLREEKNCFIYLERRISDGRIRRGLMAAMDLERYDNRPGARQPVRATEDTVPERMPLRREIREHAPLELPHAMVLMDDGPDAVLGPLEAGKDRMKRLYDTDLMLGGGHVTGWRVDGELAARTQEALDALAGEQRQRLLYGDAVERRGVIAFAVGDGNHSVLAARQNWERIKPTLSPAERETHPARFTLVELNNLHEPSLDFAPIHRLLLDTDTRVFAQEYAAARSRWERADAVLGERVAAADEFCRRYAAAHGGSVDYIHGDETLRTLAARPGCAAVPLPPVEKASLFRSVLTGGALPQKSFSIGHAEDKRYYLECRAIR